MMYNGAEVIKMRNTIEALWYGNIDPTRRFGRDNPKIRELERLMERNLDGLEKQLDEGERKVLQKYRDCEGEYHILSCEQAFCDGFCMGMKLCAEALVGTEVPV